MKIVYSSDARIPSKEANSIHVMKMCQSFKKIAESVSLVATDASDLLETDPYRFYGVEKSFNIVRIGGIPEVKGKMYIYGLRAAKYIIQQNPDYVYGRSIFTSLYLAIYNKITFGLELHQPIDSRAKDVAFRYMLKRNSLKKIVVISNKLKKYFMEKYDIDPDRLFVAPDGADIVLSESQNKVKLQECDRGYNVGYIGHLYKGKGMEIISQLAFFMPECTFHIIGGTDDDIKYWKNITKSCANIFFYGYVPHSETTQYGRLFDVVLAPYLEKVYGARKNQSMNLSEWMSPLKLFEYMAMGKTIITSNLPVIKEVLDDKKTALLCDCNDISEWVEAINYCKEHKDFCKSIGDAAKAKFEREYTWDIRANRILNALQ